MTLAKADKDRPDELIKTCLVIGVGLALGGGVMGLAWPGTEVEMYSGDLVETGSGMGVLIGALMAWLGNVVLFVALVASGASTI